MNDQLTTTGEPSADIESIMFGPHPAFRREEAFVGLADQPVVLAYLNTLLPPVSPEFGKQLDQIDQNEGE